MEKLSVGIIGCGTISPVHMEAISQYPQASVVLVCDVIEDRAKDLAKAYGCDYVTNLDQVIHHPAIDVVHILLPHDQHVPVAKKSLEAGKHVVLEKPIGICLKSILELRASMEKTGKTLGVTLQNRFNPTSLAMKKLAESGDLGPFLGGKASLTWHRSGAYYNDSPWRGDKKREGGGVLINQAIHTLDLLGFIGGPVDSLKGKVLNFDHPETTVEDTAMVELYHSQGAKSLFFASNNYHDNSRIDLRFDFEKASLQLINQEAFLIQNGTQTSLAVDQVKEGEKGYWGKGHADCISNIYDHILKGTPLMISFDEAIQATELVLGTYQASENQSKYILRKRYDG